MQTGGVQQRTQRHAAQVAARLLGWLDTWGVPALLVLGSLVVLEGTFHDHWADLVWSVRGTDDHRWPALFTRVRLWLDAAHVGLGALGAALLWRLGGRGRVWLSAAVLGSGLLDSQFWAPGAGLVGTGLIGAELIGPGLLRTGMGLAPLIVLGAALLLGLVRRRTPPLLLWGYGAALSLTLLWRLGALPADPSGSELLWNDLLRPALRDLGLAVLVLCSALVLLERAPGALRGGLLRGLVFGGLSLGTALLFTLVVGGLGALLQLQSSLWPSILAAALVAAGIDPARRGLTRSLRRVLYGERDDPNAVMQRLSLRLGGSGLPAALEGVAQSLRLPALTLRRPGAEPLIWGAEPPPGPRETFDLIAQGERLGSLEVSRRSARETFSRSERALLGGVARQLAGAVHAEQLAEQLQTSQRALLQASEEERRRLRRDLHDGLGPSLAGLGLKLEMARLLLERSPAEAAAHLLLLRGEVQESVAEVRRLVHDLRPPKLDDLGLSGALEDLLGGVRRAGLSARLEEAGPLPPLSAALEVAVYRIAQEALTNVMKHAGAGAVTLRLTARSDQLWLECQDDGVGLPEVREPGVGSRSMRERAGALAGTLELLPGPGGGTLVRAGLPLGNASAPTALGGSR